jgi:hypothetical protein
MLRAIWSRISSETSVVGWVVFSTLAVFRTCGDSRIGIEPPSIRDKRANGGFRSARICEHKTGGGNDFRRPVAHRFGPGEAAIRKASRLGGRRAGNTKRVGANVP